MGFLDKLNSNAKTRAEFEKEQSNQRKIEEKRRENELQNAEKMRIIEFKKKLEPFIQIIKDVCIKASQQGVYTDKDNRRIINGYIFVTETLDNDLDPNGVRFTCVACKLKKRHIFNDDEYYYVTRQIEFAKYKYDMNRFFDEKLENVFLDFIKEQIPEISLETHIYISDQNRNKFEPGYRYRSGVSYEIINFSIAF